MEDQCFQHRLNSDVNQLKRSMTLDLKGGPVKRPKFNAAVTVTPVLSSPDLNMLRLSTPELEEFIIALQNGSVTTTPSPTTQSFFPTTVTEKQEMYARGFVDALNELHTSDSSQMSSWGGLQPVNVPATSSNNSVGVTYTTLEPHSQQSVVSQTSTFPPTSSAGFNILSTSDPALIVKEEPQTFPSLYSKLPLSPINMECQEELKLKWRREQNRIAALRCRRRKEERISTLEKGVKILKGENKKLDIVVHRLNEQVCQLKKQVMDHVHSGCQIKVSARFSTEESPR